MTRPETMNLSSEDLHALSYASRRRLLSIRGDPFLFADWERVLFLHFAVPPELLRPYVQAPLELDLYRDQACVSLVALTMRQFRPCRRASVAWCFRPIASQRFLNLRTYVRCGDEPGALFLRGWLSQPFGWGLPSGLFGLPYTFAACDYQHHPEKGNCRGKVTTAAGRFAYRSAVGPYRLDQGVHESDSCSSVLPCEAGSLCEFALERYAGFFYHGNQPRIFRAWHPPWQQMPLEVKIEDRSLITKQFPWFAEAKFIGANFAPGFKRVWLGKRHDLQTVLQHKCPSNRVLSAFYEMP